MWSYAVTTFVSEKQSFIADIYENSATISIRNYYSS